MIFGNPGIYDKYGKISEFAILVERMNDSDCFSVNLCLNMNIYPRNLAYNLGRCISIGLLDEQITKNENEFLFNLNDKDLLIELVKMKFNDLYQLECLIRDEKIDYSMLLDDDYIYGLIDYDYETNNDYYWDIDSVEYGNVFPFIINYSGFSRVFLIIINEPGNIDGIRSRFFTRSMKVKDDNTFFDDDYWLFDSVVIRTNELEEIMRNSSEYILNQIRTSG